MWTKQFWKAAGDRALRSVAQGALAGIGTSAVMLSDVSWMAVASSAALMGVISVLTSVAFPPAEVKLAAELSSYKAKHAKDEEA